ncbi:MAG TPA: hypothetical protein VK866_16665 [Acidimicrobiales bacterium]|nr:hypothetical protein [Acidimicrobiales bacterium]
MIPTTTRRSVTALAVGLALLTACGDDADDAAAADATATTARTPITAADDSGPIEVTGVDFAYVGLPETVPAGTELAFRNDSSAELHELVAIRLPDDEERSVPDLLALPPEELGALFPLVTSVIIAPPNAEGFVVEGSATLDEPGRYAVICAIPTGADPDEYLAAAAESEGGPPEVAGGPPHFVQGMWAELVVE